MAVVIIVFLEVVDVENLYRKCSMVIPRPLKRTLQIIIQPEPVRQPRQRIRLGLLQQTLIRFLHLPPLLIRMF